MKRKIVIFSVSGVLLSVIVVAVILIFVLNRVDMSFANNAEVRFFYNESRISKELSKEDFDKVCDLFNGKFLLSDSPSCVFSEDVSIRFNDGDQVFCTACDGCPKIYWKNKDKYFDLSDNESSELKSILSGYGVHFPCV